MHAGRGTDIDDEIARRRIRGQEIELGEKQLPGVAVQDAIDNENKDKSRRKCKLQQTSNDYNHEPSETIPLPPVLGGLGAAGASRIRRARLVAFEIVRQAPLLGAQRRALRNETGAIGKHLAQVRIERVDACVGRGEAQRARVEFGGEFDAIEDGARGAGQTAARLGAEQQDTNINAK